MQQFCIKHKRIFLQQTCLLGIQPPPNNMESELANIPMIIKGIGITIKAVIATIFRKLASQDSNT